MEILEIRKNYTKPVVINFNVNVIDYKVKAIGEMLKARIFNQFKTNEADLINNDESEFPIKIVSKKVQETTRKAGMNLNLKDRLDEVVREIHLSFMTKEYLIKIINEKYPGISKKSLDTFFKDSCLKFKNKNSEKVSF